MREWAHADQLVDRGLDLVGVAAVDTEEAHHDKQREAVCEVSLDVSVALRREASDELVGQFGDEGSGPQTVLFQVGEGFDDGPATASMLGAIVTLHVASRIEQPEQWVVALDSASVFPDPGIVAPPAVTVLQDVASEVWVEDHPAPESPRFVDLDRDDGTVFA